MFVLSARGYLYSAVVRSGSFPQKMPRKKGQNSFGSIQVNTKISKALPGAWRLPCLRLSRLQEMLDG